MFESAYRNTCNGFLEQLQSLILGLQFFILFGKILQLNPGPANLGLQG